MFRRLADGIAAVAGAAVLSQFPEFFQQYIQRLGGRLDQALVQRDRLLAAAGEHALSADQYVRRLLVNADPVVRSEGRIASAALADAERLRIAHDALSGASPLQRLLDLARNLDPELARATLDSFVPAVPLTPEALAYAGVGMVAGLVLLATVESIAAGVLRAARGAPGRS
jgi:hypothetical protein